MRKLMVLPAILLFVGIVGAFTITVVPSLGFEHNVPAEAEVNESGAPVAGVRYFLTDGGVTREVGSATVFSEATVGGLIDLNYGTVGDCVWSGVIGTEVVALEDLQDRAIGSGDKVFWSYVADNPAMIFCSATIDLNVVS